MIRPRAETDTLNVLIVGSIRAPVVWQDAAHPDDLPDQDLKPCKEELSTTC